MEGAIVDMCIRLGMSQAKLQVNTLLFMYMHICYCCLVHVPVASVLASPLSVTS